MYAEADPYQRHRHEDGLHRASRVAARALGPALAILAVCGGMGWLYLLRNTTFLAAGPRLHGALPLEELASKGAQPLLRMAVAWLPSGFAAGVALAMVARLRPALVAPVCGLLAFVILFPTTAASEAVTRNEHFSDHVGPALWHPGMWGAIAFVVIGSLLAAAAAVRGPGRPRWAASRAGASSSAGP